MNINEMNLEKIGNISIYQGDGLDLMDYLAEKRIKVDLIIADLPYGTTRCKWDEVIPFDLMWERINKVKASKKTPVLLHGAEPFSSKLRMSNLDNYKYDWVWDKVRKTGFLNAKKQPLRCHEFIHVFYENQCFYNPIMTKGHPQKSTKRKRTIDGGVYGSYGQNEYKSDMRYPKSILTFSTDTQKISLHRTQKPVALIEYMIKTYSKEGDVVLDFTAGAMTTGVAAHNLNRICYLAEKDAAIYNTGKERLISHIILDKRA